MLFTSYSKAIFCFLVCFVEIKLGSLQSSNPSSETENKIRAIVNDIYSFKFNSAEEQILKLNDHSKIARIIHDVYQNKEDSFPITFQFTRAFDRDDLSFYALKALRNEMVANKHSDPLKLIPLAKEFSSLFKESRDVFLEAESKKIISEIKADMKISAAEILAQAMLAKDYYLNVDAENLAESIFNFDYDLNDEIMREMVNRTYRLVPAIKIVKTIMSSSKFIPQKVSVFLEVFKKLKEDNDLDNEAVVELGTCIKQLREKKDYSSLSHHQKYDINVMIEKLPTCARNLFYADNICIWNRGKMEYLYSPAKQNFSSSQSSAVYTCPEDVLKLEECSWEKELFFSKFVVKSQTNKEEVLGVSMRRYDWQTHYVDTKIYKLAVDRYKNTWEIELSGEYCFLRNEQSKEYLFASNERPNKRERLVFSAPSSAAAYIDPINFQWQIRDCS